MKKSFKNDIKNSFLKQTKLYISLYLIISCLLVACSTSKNTPMSRRYHAMTTKFNIAFNGNQSFKEGLENIDKANKDDYSEILHLNPISNHENASSAGSNMERAIEKSRKAIKLHSIKKKPEKDYSKSRDPEYMAFYNQKEFNPELKKSWIQLGQAEFYKGDFLGASGTFSFITRHYESTPEMVQKAKIWMARSYNELDWLYESDNILRKIKSESLFDSNKNLYAVTMADLLIKQDQLEQVIPFLEQAIDSEKDRKLRVRYCFVMAQIMEKTGNKKAASEYYTKVLKTSPPYEMAFNAQINRAQLLEKSVQSIERELKGMTRNSKNKEFKDQIYTALGNIFMNEKDTVKAKKYYNQAIEESTRNGIEKGVALLKMGELYWNLKEYVKAFPYYDEAAKIYTVDFKNYKTISHRAEVLGELAKEHEVIILQDSLQQLAKMSKEDRLAAINRTIEQVKEAEKKAEEAELLAQQPSQDDKFSMPQPIGTGNSGNWYFYNPQNVSKGKNEFRRQWGNRKLEDNWRRSNKSAALFAENNSQIMNDSIPSDSLLIADNDSLKLDPNIPEFEQTNDNKSIGYYMAQIPFTEAQIKKSNEQWATSLYNMGMIYKDKIEDYPLAYATFEEFEKRFNYDKRILETLYSKFLMASKEQKNNEANDYRNSILSQFPESKYAEMLKDPDFIKNQQEMYLKQDEIYNQTYSAFTKSNYAIVFENTEKMKSKYSLSSLLPQFEFLNTLSIGKTKSPKEFEKSLNELVKNYPNNDISAMAKDILALLNQGYVAKEGSTFGTLLNKREVENKTPEEIEDMRFSELKFTPHRLMLITPASNEGINKLQYKIAIFNFSRFMIRDFGFQLSPIDSARRALCVSNLASYNEGVWYKNTLATDKELMQLMDSLQVEPMIISDDNFNKLKTKFTLEEYLTFEENTLKKNIPEALLTASTNVPLYDTSIKTVEIIDGTNLDKKKETTEKITKEKTSNNQTTEKVRPEKVETDKTIDNKDIVKEKTVAENKSKESETAKKDEKKQEKAKTETQERKQRKDKETTVKIEKKEAKPTENKHQEVPKTAISESLDPIKEQITKRANIILTNAEYTRPNERTPNLYKKLFIFNANSPHYVALYIPKGGKYDFKKIKKAFESYNDENYKMMNLKIWEEKYEDKNVIFIGSFEDANIAKSYFMRVLKDSSIRKATSGMNKRNLIITQENINTLLHEDALDIYFDFLKAYYLN